MACSGQCVRGSFRGFKHRGKTRALGIVGSGASRLKSDWGERFGKHSSSNIFSWPTRGNFVPRHGAAQAGLTLAEGVRKYPEHSADQSGAIRWARLAEAAGPRPGEQDAGRMRRLMIVTRPRPGPRAGPENPPARSSETL